MNEIISKFLLAGDKFIPKMHLRQPMCSVNQDLLIVLLDHPLKTKKNLEKRGIPNIFITSNWTKLAFNMIWLMEILEI